MQPAISVLTSCYNAAEFLEDSIASVLEQSWDDFEYLLIDDGSTDETPAIIARYAAQDRRIVPITKPNTGLTDSLNVGLRLARGEWIARLDADDMALPERLAAQLDYARRHDGLALLGSSSIEVDREGRFIKQQSFPEQHRELVWNLEHVWRFFAHSSALFNRQLALALGGYCRRFTRSQDWDLWLRLSSVGQLGCLRQPLVKTRLLPTSITHSASGRQQKTMGLAATICHLRRRAGLSDPSQLSEGEWQKFLRWVERRQEEKGYFCKAQTRQALRDIWFIHAEANLVLKFLRSLAKLYRCAHGFSLIRDELRGTNIALTLARESARVIA